MLDLTRRGPRIISHDAGTGQHGRRGAAAQRPAHPRARRGRVRRPLLDVRGTRPGRLPGGEVLLDQGLVPGDRVGSYGHNSDAYLIGFLACARAGLVHVPVNQNLTGDDLALHRRPVRQRPRPHRPGLPADSPDDVRTLPLRDADDSLLAAAGRPPTRVRRARAAHRGPGAAAVHLRHDRPAQGRDDDAPRPGPRVPERHHRPRPQRGRPARALAAALPLGADACVPAAVPRGRRRRTSSSTRPTATGSSTWSRPGRADSLFAPPTVWIGLSNRPDFATRDLGGLRKAYYGASIMPVPVLERLRERLPKLGLLQLLRAERDRPPGHRPRTRRARGPDGLLRPARPLRRGPGGRRGRQGGARRHARRSRLPLPAVVRGLLGQARGDRRGLPRRLVPLRRPRGAGRAGLLHDRRPGEGRHQLRWRTGRLTPGRGRPLHP